MNKFEKVLLAILGGVDVFFTVATPMFILFFYIVLFGINSWQGYLLLAITLLSSFFRAIKIGWIKK